MKQEDVRIGMRVVPQQKTVLGSLENSLVWNNAQKQGQDFLYVTGWDDEYQAFLLHNDVSEEYVMPDGDFYYPEDFEPFEDKFVLMSRFKTFNRVVEDIQTLWGDMSPEEQDELIRSFFGVLNKNDVLYILNKYTPVKH